ncbi:syntaxin 16, partial [Phenoliferia sp. Uapishka_3]
MAASAGPGPFTRSRTNLFLSYRDSAVRSSSSSTSFYHTPLLGHTRVNYDNDDDEDESKGLMDEEAEVGLGAQGRGKRVLPPKWVDVAEKVDEIVDKVRPKIAHLDKLHAKHILPGFKDRTAEEREIELLANDITRDFRLTQKYIRQIAEMSKSLLTNGPATEAKRVDLIMAANVQTALATKVQELSGVFRKKQTAYLRQLKGHERSNDSSTKDPLASLADDEQYSQSFLQADSQSQTQQLATPANQDFQRREAEINSIAQSITDLADLFKDLSSLVIDQGTLLDRVDWNVEQMGVEVRGAVEELKVATTYQRRSGKCQLIFLLILLIAGAFIVLLYRPHGAPPPPPFPDDSPLRTDDILNDVGILDIETRLQLKREASREASRFIEGNRRGKSDGSEREARRRRRDEASEWPFREGRA